MARLARLMLPPGRRVCRGFFSKMTSRTVKPQVSLRVIPIRDAEAAHENLRLVLCSRQHCGSDTSWTCCARAATLQAYSSRCRILSPPNPRVSAIRPEALPQRL